MIIVEGNKIIADTKTQKITFIDGCLTEIVSKIDGERYLYDERQNRECPLYIVYPFERVYNICKREYCKINVIQYNKYLVNVSFYGWHGHGDMLIEEEIETGMVNITPSVQTSLPGLRACRWELYGIHRDAEVILPFFQGFKTRMDSSLLNWECFDDLRYPYRWEENFVAFGTQNGGFWIWNQGARGRYKKLHVGNEETPYYVAFDTENYGPAEDKCSAGGVTWKINTYKGDWQTPVMKYKKVLMADVSWEKSKATLPEWFDDIHLAVSWCPTNPDILDALKRYIDPKKVIIHLPNWRQHIYDQGYPDYTASETGKAFIAKGNEMGYHIAPHFNCFEIDPSMPEFELVRDFRFRNIEDHRAMGWTILNNNYGDVPEDNMALRTNREYNVMTKIHPALPVWKNLLAGNMKKAVDNNNLHMVFTDISHNTHNIVNSLVNDTTTIKGTQELISFLGQINGGITVGGEGMNETLLCQHFAQGHSVFNGEAQTMIPVENYLPINHMLFGELCHIIGYHPQNDINRQILQDDCDKKRGFVPTLFCSQAEQLCDKNSVARKIIERATN